MPKIIHYFREKQLGQTMREEGPSWHQSKSGTPTMGGVVILIASMIAEIVGILLYPTGRNHLALLLAVIIFFGGLGFIDDYLILIKKQNEGLTAKQKFVAQIVGAILVFVVLLWFNHPTILHLPFFTWRMPKVLYGIFVVFWITGFSNATNLTDGIDGLMATNGVISYMTYAAIAAALNRYEVMFFCLSIVGSLLGFYLYNKKPAQIFMGDVGSLALGAGLAVVSILLFEEWSLLLIGMTYVMETASVMIQVAYYKKTGKRFFKMTPIHHHFEMSGWSETQIVTRFGLLSIIGALVGIWGVLL